MTNFLNVANSPNVDPIYFETSNNCQGRQQVFSSEQTNEYYLKRSCAEMTAELHDLALWKKFASVPNEMILTKNGR